MSTPEDPAFRRLVSGEEQLDEKIDAGLPLTDREVERTNMRPATQDEYKSFRDTLAIEATRDLSQEAAQLAREMDTGPRYNQRESAEEWIWLMVEREFHGLKLEVMQHGYTEDQYLEMLCYWALNFERNRKQGPVNFSNPPAEKLKSSREKLNKLGGGNLVDEPTVVKWLIKEVFGYRDQEKVVKKIHRLISTARAELVKLDQNSKAEEA